VRLVFEGILVLVLLIAILLIAIPLVTLLRHRGHEAETVNREDGGAGARPREDWPARRTIFFFTLVLLAAPAALLAKWLLADLVAQPRHPLSSGVPGWARAAALDPRVIAPLIVMAICLAWFLIRLAGVIADWIWYIPGMQRSAADPPGSVRCWRCKKSLTVTASTRGQRVRCPQCGTKQELPL
jgi:hypothetical protein